MPLRQSPAINQIDAKCHKVSHLARCCFWTIISQGTISDRHIVFRYALTVQVLICPRKIFQFQDIFIRLFTNLSRYIKLNSLFILSRLKRRTSCPRILALRRLWDFIISTISFSLSPWRIILSRLGRPGTGELKGNKSRKVPSEMTVKSPEKLCYIPVYETSQTGP